MAKSAAAPPPSSTSTSGSTSTSASASASGGGGGGSGGEMSTIDAVAAGAGSCIGLAVGSAISGGAIGGLFGLVSGLFRREGFKKAMSEAGASGRTFAIMSGVHSLVSASLKKIRNKDDVINQAVAGCATGIALGWGGTPVSMLQNCAGFAVFAFIFEGMNPPAQPAIAAEMHLLGLGLPPHECSSGSSTSSGYCSSGSKQCECNGDICGSCSSSSPSASFSRSLAIPADCAADATCRSNASSSSSSSSSSTGTKSVSPVHRHEARRPFNSSSSSGSGISGGSSVFCATQQLPTVLPLSLSLPLAAQFTLAPYHACQDRLCC
ncbi:hypothetical protein CLOP_g11958 [Closterium sp. NIES-67]|nr:hypothetical protein CLOP_g11958 [Closterium sp. NIES-67]